MHRSSCYSLRYLVGQAPSLASLVSKGNRMVSKSTAVTGPPRAPTVGKREGDISDSFVSLAGIVGTPLPDHYRTLKLSLAAGHESALVDSWHRLLAALRRENAETARRGPGVIPELRFGHLDEDLEAYRDTLAKRGVAVIRSVIPPDEARDFKNAIEAYVAKNPDTRGFPAENRQVFELYWSAAQLRARAHPNLMHAQRRLMQALWHVSDDDLDGHQAQGIAAAVDLAQPIVYADRLRIRQPGDTHFALGPHQDGGSVERWDPAGYSLGHVYDAVFAGRWEEYDPWDAGQRAAAVCDLHQGLGSCSAFRTFQGWLSMSHTGPREGTLLVYPLVKLATVYTLLRPFFRPVLPARECASRGDNEVDSGFLCAANWIFTGGEHMTSDLQGATPGHGQEFPDGPDGTPLHPHLELTRTMVHVPQVVPGDYVVWHCDIIHAVDPVHNGTGDASVLYIPVCPLTEGNAHYLVRQRTSFLSGVPSPDFPGGKGESEHVDRPAPAKTLATYGDDALRAMGMARLEPGPGAGRSANIAAERANAILGL